MLFLEAKDTMKKLLFVLALLLLNFRVGARKTHHEISWNPSITPQFRFGNIHSIDVKVNQYMDISCPQYDADASETLTFIIYNVSKESFDECKLTEDAKKIFHCNTPTHYKKLTTKFQRRSPNPLGFTFLPGHTYYYMAFLDELIDELSCNKAMRMSVTVHPMTFHGHNYAKSNLKDRDVPPTTKTTTTTTTSTTTTTKILSKFLIATTERTAGRTKVQKQVQNPRGSSTVVRSSLFFVLLSLVAALLVQR